MIPSGRRVAVHSVILTYLQGHGTQISLHNMRDRQTDKTHLFIKSHGWETFPNI